MSALIMDTRNHANALREQLKGEVSQFKQQHKITPNLVILAVSDDQNVFDYIRVVSRNALKLGLRASANILPEDISLAELRQHIEELNANPNIHAISLQTPLPKTMSVSEVGGYISPLKDVEGLNPTNSGATFLGNAHLSPPPALAGMRLLSLYNINPAGRHAVIVGRNPIIGKPLNVMLTEANATVTTCHRQTVNLSYFTRQADILVVAAQSPNLITAEMVKPGAVVVDYGINYVSGRVHGDVNFESVRAVAGAVTPMPGGTGPLTVIMLLANTLKAAAFQANAKASLRD